MCMFSQLKYAPLLLTVLCFKAPRTTYQVPLIAPKQDSSAPKLKFCCSENCSQFRFSVSPLYHGKPLELQSPHDHLLCRNAGIPFYHLNIVYKTTKAKQTKPSHLHGENANTPYILKMEWHPK
uniref:Putative secreted protein n=1 Tax=Rhipicephalus microplus TaxID=6941 RepID=A0A6M2D8R6_RHIMP